MNVWDKSSASHGRDKIGCIIHFLKNKTASKKIMYSNCCYVQNRNIEMATPHNPIASSLIIFSRTNRGPALRSISLSKIRSKEKKKLISMARPMPFLYPQGHQIMVNKDLPTSFRLHPPYILFL